MNRGDVFKIKTKGKVNRYFRVLMSINNDILAEELALGRSNSILKTDIIDHFNHNKFPRLVWHLEKRLLRNIKVIINIPV